jgi:hypothetical protein
MASSSRAGDTAPPDGSDPAPAGTEAERRPETERAGARTSEGAASSAQQRPASSGAASARASGDTITLTTWVGTWNVGNVAPKMDAVTQWLARARGHDLVAVAAQEASYPHSRANLKPEAVWAETLAARRGGDAEAENARDAARLVAEAGSTASDSDSEEAHDAAGRAALDEDGTDAHSVNADKSASAGCDSSVFAKKKRGFFGSSKFARASGALAGALAGGVAAGPLAPFGLVAGAAAGYYSSARVAAELKSRRHWFDLVAAAMGPEYCMVQTATLLQMRLVVFAKKKTVMEKRLIRSTRVGYQATGLLGAVGNKGGLMVRLGFSHGGAVAFVACHLAAHEGEKHVTARDESVAAILRGCWDGSVEKAVGETDVGSARELARDRDPNDADSGKTSTGEFSQKSSGPSVQKRPTDRSDAHGDVASNTTETRELLACTDHVFVFGDLNYRVDPGAVENDSSSSAEKRLKKLGWGARWKKTNDAPSGSLVAAVAGLAKKTEKRKNADAAFRRNAAKEVAAPKSAEGVETAMHPADASESEELKNDADDVSGSAAAMTRWVEGWLAVADLAALGRFDALAEGDQLRREMSRGRALRGFVEAPITFAPTFKLETSSSQETRGAEEDPGGRGDVDVGLPRSVLSREYARKRIPSWCDRVLVRSLAKARACRFLTYASCPGVRSSDHAPVYASCELDFSSRGGGAFLLPSERESVFTQNVRLPTSESSPTRRVALRVRVSSFRVALEDDEDEDCSTVSVEKTNGDDDDDDDSDDASSDDGRYDVPGTPLYRAGSRTGRETMMEKLVARAASLKIETRSETSVCGNAETTSADLPRLSRNLKRSPRPSGARDASSGARAAMEKLQRGATATARFSFPFSEKEKQKGVETFAAAGVTCRPAQPFVRDLHDDATSSAGETNGVSNERDFRDGTGTDSRFTPATVTAHWAAASLPVVELGVCDVTNLRDVVRELGGRVAVASVAIDKEHAGSAIIDLGEVCFAFRGAAENADSVFVESQSPQTVSAAFDVPFDRFARRRGRAEGTLTLEVVSVGEEE